MARTPFSTSPQPASQPTPMPPPPGASPPQGAGRPSCRAARARSRAGERRTLVVGRGISVQGTVQDAERLVVEGTVEASMIHATELAISPRRRVQGRGRGRGRRDRRHHRRHAHRARQPRRPLHRPVLGTARCRRLQVEDGGQITGRIEMITDGAAPRPEPVRAPTPEPATSAD